MGWTGHAGGSDAASQALAAQARAGDMAALAKLHQLASPGGYAPDHRNAAIDAWNSLGMGPPIAEMKNPHGFLGDWDKAIGTGLKFAAPFAGLIPGVGPLAGMALAAGGSALGGQMHGDKFSLLDTALAGGAGYLGGKWNPFGGHAAALPGAAGYGNSTTAGAGSSALADVGNAGTGALPSAAYESFPGIPGGFTDPGMSAGGGGFLDNIFGGAGGHGGLIDKALQYGPMIVGGIGQAHRQHESDQMLQDAIRGAQAEYGARAPLRDFAQSQILSLPGLQRPDLSSVFADPGNPFYRAA